MNNCMGRFAVLVLALSAAFTMSAVAQTTNEGPAPSDQPSAPMEIGQAPPPSPDAQAGPNEAEPNEGQPSDMSGGAQPTEAQPGGPSGEAPAQTDQGVARISLIHGDVSTQRGDSGDWSAATLNQPAMTGDKVSTGNDSRVELQLDFANILRLGPNSQVNLASLTKRNIQLQVAQGIATFSVSKDSEAEPEIDTPNVSVHPAHHDGVFRIEVRPDGDTIVIVRQGQAQIATPQGSTEVDAGQMATIRGTSDAAQYKISSAPDRDDWDRWNSDRDHLISEATSWRHTNRYYTGSQDLDAYGQWQNVPDYGNVWVPNEPDGWVPYRDGNWTYEPYYGWTWVGYEPWGWAPYHYGRWFPYGGAWAWWPGPLNGGFYRPFWSPAYVSFFGWGAGFGFGFGFGGWGGFGWLPIGPCDWFHPWWGGYGGRFGVVGFRGGFDRFGGFAPLHGGNRFSNIANMHDAHVGRALSTVNAGHFGAGRVTAMGATRAQLSGARMMAGNLPVVPSRASLSASGRAASPSTIHNGGSQSFFGSHNNVARPASFQQQTAGLRQSMAANHVGAIPAGGRTSAGTSGGFRGAAASGSTQKPSAGTVAAREGESPSRSVGSRSFGAPNNTATNHAATNNTEPNRSATNNTSNHSLNNGSRSSGYGNSERSSAGSASERTNMGSPNMGSRSMGSENMGSRTTGSANGGGFRPFSPPPSSQASRSGSYNGSYSGASASASRSSGGSYWNRTAQNSSSSAGRSGNSYGGSYGRGSTSSRPQLDMRQPIARSPSGGYGGYGGYSRGTSPSYGGYSRGTSPSYGGSRGASPSYGGSRGASPSYGGRAPNGAGRYSMPSSRSSGGHSSGGRSSGGHSSAGHSSGGHSGGGGHSSGGHGGGHR